MALIGDQYLFCCEVQIVINYSYCAKWIFNLVFIFKMNTPAKHEQMRTFEEIKLLGFIIGRVIGHDFWQRAGLLCAT